MSAPDADLLAARRAAVEPARVAVDVTGVAPAGAARSCADVFFSPEALADVLVAGGRPDVLWCLPGGGMSRRYFDLDVPGEAGSYSMARHLAAHGAVVVTVDHCGVGDSDVPDDAYLLTPRVVADVNDRVVGALGARLRDGSLAPGLGALGVWRSVGVGHSAGALLSAYQQARHRRHDALVLLGFGGGGLVEQLRDDEKRFANDPDGLREALAGLVRARFGRPLPGGSTATSPYLLHGDVPDAALAALGQAKSVLLALVGLTSMVPGASAAELAGVSVPVLVGVGDHDITGPVHAVARHLPGCRDLTLYELADAGHNHNVASTRHLLWDRVAAWLRSLPLPG